MTPKSASDLGLRTSSFFRTRRICSASDFLFQEADSVCLPKVQPVLLAPMLQVDHSHALQLFV